MYIFIYIRRPLVGHQAAEVVCIQCPLQVYGPQSSSYLSLFTSFEYCNCLIATGTAQDEHFTINFGRILNPMALQSGILVSIKPVLPPW